MSIALLLLPLALATPEFRSVEMGDEPEFVLQGFSGPVNWELVKWDHDHAAMISAHVGDTPDGVRTRFRFRLKAPGLTVLAFKCGAKPDAPHHVVVLQITPRKAGVKP